MSSFEEQIANLKEENQILRTAIIDGSVQASYKIYNALLTSGAIVPMDKIAYKIGQIIVTSIYAEEKLIKDTSIIKQEKGGE